MTKTATAILMLAFAFATQTPATAAPATVRIAACATPDGYNTAATTADTKHDVDLLLHSHGRRVRHISTAPASVPDEYAVPGKHAWFRYATCTPGDFLYVVYASSSNRVPMDDRRWVTMNYVEGGAAS